MQTEDHIKSIISKVDYLDWKIRLGEMGDGWFIQVQFDAPDSESGLIETQHCRKWYISKWMTDTEVVDTIYAAFERAVLHEFKETFRFDNRAIYNPHTSTEARYESCIKTEHRESPKDIMLKQAKKFPKRPSVAQMILEDLQEFAKHDDGPVAIEPKIISFCKPEDAEQYRKDAINAFHRIMEKETARKPLPNQMSFLDKE